jgi:hypothetical protein
MQFTAEECNLLRQWYNAVEDLAPEYLTKADKDLMQKIAVTWADTWRQSRAHGQ